MGALLVAAFTAVNALSLLHMALIAVGMAAPARPRRAAWRFCSLPLLAALLLLQYSVLLGPPPGFDWGVWPGIGHGHAAGGRVGSDQQERECVQA